METIICTLIAFWLGYTLKPKNDLTKFAKWIKHEGYSYNWFYNKWTKELTPNKDYMEVYGKTTEQLVEEFKKEQEYHKFKMQEKSVYLWRKQK